MSAVQPLIQEIDYRDPLEIFAIFALDNWSILLDSADAKLKLSALNRYTYIAIDPFSTITCKNRWLQHDDQSMQCDDPFTFLSELISQYAIVSDPKLPPFQGGAAGYFAYDLCHYLEKITYHANDDMDFADLAIGFFDLIISFDHLQQRAWIIASGFPEKDSNARLQRAKQRLSFALKKIACEQQLPEVTFCSVSANDIPSNFSQVSYQAAVTKMIDYIRAGDIFEANMSQRFMTSLPERFSTFDLYRRLRKINPAPFAAYLNVAGTVIASSSPERFLQLQENRVETRPIKGTRPRGKTLAEDLQLAEELKASAKDHAENIMIVDLMRNDLSKVCENHSVIVPQLCGLESYASVHHLVSVVQGKLNKGLNAIDLLRAAFPGGSVTGAPKIRAMEIIAELEPNRRGPYCGSIGYIGFDGCLDSSIVIRTYAIKNRTVTFQVGGAVLADSDPKAEYEETLHKARLLLNGLTNDSYH